MEFFLLVSCLACASAVSAPAQDKVFITELVAANNGTLLDEDGAASDWIEIHNAGDTVNLAGWHLTDDPGQLAKWTFPATNLAPGGFLIVFASGKDRAVSGQPLHTSFQLDSTGEYLALVKPDGVTVAHAYAPTFPPQVSGVSYGVELSVATTMFLTNGAVVKWWVPSGPGAYPASWPLTNFNDANWANGFTGLGFQTASGSVFGPGPATNLALAKPTSQSSTNSSFGSNRGVDGDFNSYTHTLANANLPATWEVNLGTHYGIERLVLWNRTSNRSRLRDITVRILAANGTTNYTSALLNPENVLGGGVLNAGPVTLSLNVTQLTGGLVGGGRIRVTRTPDPDLSGSGGGGSASEADVLSLAEVEVFGVPYSAGGNFVGHVQTALGSAMTNINASALIRVPFLIPEEEMPELDRLILRMEYDDGFVAWLNGVEVARRNAPVALAWNSSATAEHSDAAAVQFEDIDVTPFLNLLQEGENVLAIQGLNVSATNQDFLILPQLVGVKTTAGPDRYFAQPTPGATNGGGYLGLVADTKFSVDRGFYNAPFTVAITSATVGAEIRFTTNGSTPSAVGGILYTSPIAISRPTALRAVATKPGWLPSDVDTHTYIFLNHVITQSTASATAMGFPATWPGSSVDYAMDPSVTGPNAAQMTNALRALPSVFITTSISNLFDPGTGIYANPLQTGVGWERPVSLEMIGTNGLSEFQENCGVRIQGGVFFRSFSMTQKKSFRVLFKGQYGTGRLHHDLFNEPGAVEEFDGFVLRAGANDGYAWSGAGTTVQFTRDEFGRRLALDMGHPTPRGMFVHLYLNGLYWGLYNLVERPNEDFSAAYLGGEPEEWDACAAGDYKNGGTAAATRWNTFTSQTSQVTTHAGYQALQGNHPDGTRNPALPLYYDKSNYLDYMIANIWGGNWDWPNKNFWFGYHPAADSTGYKFYMWDFENTMGNSRDRSPLNMVSPRPEVAATWVGLPHYYLQDYTEYRMDFADRVQRYFFNGGLFTPQVLTNRYRQLADAVQPAIVAESARWGDDNRTPAYGLTEWLGERDWILTNYLPQRSSIVLNQLIASGLFPTVSAPAFSQFGGAVPAGYTLSMSHTNAAGALYFTLDGSDPRVPGTGSVAPAAQVYSLPATINAPTLVRARVLNGVWSALTEAVFYPPQDLGKLSLTELMYHAPDSGPTDGDELDFIELKNTGTNALNLSGLTFTAGISFTFTNNTTLAPGQFFVLARNASALAAKYPGLIINGSFSGKLDNGGETLTLSHPLGATVFSVTYDDQTPWPVAPDGFGFSLVPGNPGLTQAPDNGSSWRASAQAGGSPGADDPAPNIPAVVISEILTHTDPPQTDAIELYNPNDDPADLSGWLLTDDPATPTKFRIPNGTVLAGGGRIFFDENDFNPAPGVGLSFGISSTGDDVYLFSAATNGQLTGYTCGASFGAAFNGVSFGRVVNSAGDEFFPLETAVTLGSPNAAVRLGPLVINEIHYHPAAGGDEFVELLNLSGSAAQLFHPAFPTNAWKFGGLGFTFPTNITLGSGELLLLVATNPAAFRAKYSVPAAVQIFGPVSGSLQDSGELLELQMPDAPNTNLVPYVTIDAVRYNDKTPWPPAADGAGPSLQRIQAAGFGNEPLNWVAAAPTPGQPYTVSDTDGDGLPDAWETAYGTSVNFADADADPDHDGLTNWQEFLAGTHPNDSGSVLKVLNVNSRAANIGFQFTAVSNRTYSVLHKSTLAPDAWNKLLDVPAHPTNRLETVTDALVPAGTRFYLIVTPAQP